MQVWHCKTAATRSIEATAAQVVGDDDVSDGVKDELDVVGVGRASLVTVNFLRRALVLGLELRLDVCRCFLVALLTYTTPTPASASITGVAAGRHEAFAVAPKFWKKIFLGGKYHI